MSHQIRNTYVHLPSYIRTTNILQPEYFFIAFTVSCFYVYVCVEIGQSLKALPPSPNSTGWCDPNK